MNLASGGMRTQRMHHLKGERDLGKRQTLEKDSLGLYKLMEAIQGVGYAVMGV
jgi:hypothetical protein